MEEIVPSVSELHRALIDKNFDNVRALVKAGTDVNEVYRQETAFTRAAQEVVGQADELCVEEILNCPNFDPNACNQFDHTPLHEAAKVGRADWVDRLLEMGARPDVVDIAGVSPLTCCASSDSDVCALSLIRQGANVNEKSKDGMTPLHRACAKGATKMARLLLHHGSDVNTACNKGETPLMSAISFYYHYTFGNKKFIDLLDLCEALVGAGCDLNAHDNNGKTALHREVESNNIYGVIFLVQRGCDLNVRNIAGLTPYQTATLPESTKYELARYLLHYGASVVDDTKDINHPIRQRTCPIHCIMQGISKYKLNNQAVACRSLLLQALSESVFPRTFLDREDISSPQRTPTNANETNTNEAASSPRILRRLTDTEQAVTMWAQQASGQPCSLQHQAKLRVRAALGGVNIISKIQQLPIGASMKRYLNLGVPLEQSSLYKEVRLHAAVFSNDLNEVKKSIESGANVKATFDGESAFSIALRIGTENIISELFRHISSSSQALSPSVVTSSNAHSSVSLEDLSFQSLANTHYSTLGDTTLHLVARAGQTKYVPTALELCKDHLDVKNFAARTPLEEAVCCGHFSTAECLIESGASLFPCPAASGGTDEEQTGPSLLHLAAASGAKRLVELLLEKGADVNAIDKYGFTPLRLALGGVSDPKINIHYVDHDSATVELNF